MLTKVVCADILGRRRRGLARLRDGAWLRRPWAAAEPKGLAAAAVGAGGTEGPGCGGRGRRRGLAGLRNRPRSRQARVWRSRGRAAAHGRIKQPGPTAGSNNTWNTSDPLPPPTDTAHRCRPRAHQAARPHSRIQQHSEHQRPTTTTHRHRPQMPPTGASSSPAPQTRATRHAPPDTRHQTRATRHAPGTPAGPQPQTRQSGPEPLGSGPPSMLSN